METDGEEVMCSGNEEENDEEISAEKNKKTYKSKTKKETNENNDINVTNNNININKSIKNKKFNRITEPIQNDEGINESDLLFYYGRLYPFNLLFRWLTYKNDPTAPPSYLNDPLFFSKREISFTSCTNKETRDEIYLRWQAFKTAKQLKEKVMSMRPTPHKFDVGAVYTLPIHDRDSHARTFKPMQKELVFDIDMNDYDDIRTCCKDKKICKKCWMFLVLACRVLEAALREDFSCKKILWVYSGRRGIHGWVCDASVRTLPTDGRGGIADYLNILTGTEHQKKKVLLKGKEQHPHVERSFEICMQHFGRLLEEQDFFCSGSPHLQKTLNYLPDLQSMGEGYSKKNAEDVKAKMEEWMKKKNKFNSVEFFNQLCEYGNMRRSDGGRFCILEVNRMPPEERKVILLSCKNWIKEIVLAFSYPRLDIHVSKDMGHLLKAPFCVHHGTGRVCVPIDIREVEKIDPMCVPTLSLLRREFDKSSSSETSDIEDRTSLGYYTYFFRSKFVEGTVKMTSGENKEILSEIGKLEADW